MPEGLRSRVVKARKRHTCSCCLDPIEKGELYRRDTNLFDGQIYDWLSHMHCDTIANAIWDFVQPDDEGMSEAVFQESVQQVLEELYCPANCPKWDADSGCPESGRTTCLRKLAEHLKTHELRQCMADSGIRVWRLVPRDTLTRGEPR